MSDQNITYLTPEQVEEMLELDAEAVVFVVDSNKVPRVLKLKTLVKGLSEVSFDVDGGSFI